MAKMTPTEISIATMRKKWGDTKSITDYAKNGATHIVLSVYKNGNDLIPVGHCFGFRTIQGALDNQIAQGATKIFYCQLG